MTTEDEGLDIKRYDRQIRLWGMETQRALPKVRVLLLHANGLSNEIAKNLVLAGIGHISILDEGGVAAEDRGGVFSADPEQAGISRARGLVMQLRSMNPSTDLVAEPRALSELDRGFFASFHFIVGTHGAEAVRAFGLIYDRLSTDDGGEAPPAKRARGAEGGTESGAARPKMMAVGTLGMAGYSLFDLGDYAYTEKVQQARGEDATEDAPAAEEVKRRALYPDIRSAMAVEWAALGKRVPRAYYGLQLLVEAEEGEGAAGMVARWQAKLDSAGGQGPDVKQRLAGVIDEEYVKQLGKLSTIELSPICAVVGGIVAGEVIKVISGSEAPLNNALFFDGKTGEGLVLRIGQTPS